MGRVESRRERGEGRERKEGGTMEDRFGYWERRKGGRVKIRELPR